MDFGSLGLTHEIIGMLYLIAFNLEDDQSFGKDDVINSIQEIIKKMDELANL